MSETKARGRLWLDIGGRGFAGSGRIRLLEEINRRGSIAAAARAVGMSYKAAWLAVDRMNRLAERPLLERQTGGHGGGGTVLTDHGVNLIRRYRHAESRHSQFLDQLSREAREHDDAPD